MPPPSQMVWKMRLPPGSMATLPLTYVVPSVGLQL